MKSPTIPKKFRFLLRPISLVLLVASIEGIRSASKVKTIALGTPISH
jgi:hypothetical protein